MAETILNAEIGEVYQRLKTQLAINKCKVVSEEPPTVVRVVQGSLWGTSARTAQKTIAYTLHETPQGTTVTSKTTLTKAYINFTLVGVVFSVVMMGICVWIAMDLQGGTRGLWSWLAQTEGYPDFEKAALLARLSWVLAAFLAATLAVEGIVVARILSKIDVFTQENLEALKKTCPPSKT